MDGRNQANELRAVLSGTKELLEGPFGKIFSRNRRNGTFNCRLCCVENLPGEFENLMKHINGKKHQKRLDDHFGPDARTSQAPLSIIPESKIFQLS